MNCSIDLRLENLLTKNRIVSSTTLKEELKIKKNSSFIRLLMNSLLETLEDINYSTGTIDLKFLLRILNYVKVTNEEEFKLMESFVYKANQIIVEKKNLFNKENNINFSLLEFLHDQLRIFVIDSKLMLLDHKEKVLPQVDNQTLKKIICDLIFRFKNYDYVAILFKHYENVENLKINGQTIVIRILENYIKTSLHREYFSRIISLIISKNGFALNEKERITIINMIKYCLGNFILSKEELLFLKELMVSIDARKLDTNERINMLKDRFNIKVINAPKFVRFTNENIVDMTKRKIITIDSNGARILDDALSFEKKPDGTYELGIYITDLSAIKVGTKLDLNAFRQFATIYTEDQVIHMLPEPMLEKYFSLNCGLHRVMAFTFKFNNKYELLDCDIKNALISVSANFNHDDVSDILKDSMGDNYQLLKCLLDISEAINETFSYIDKYHTIKSIVRELGEDEIPEKYLDTPGSRIVSANMIFLNQYLASYFYAHKLPFIYRVNERQVDDEVLKLIVGRYRLNKDVKKLLKSLSILYKPSMFSSYNKGHKGLNLQAYTQATSPAIKYVSLYIQRMLMDLFVTNMPEEEYMKKYQNVDEVAAYFTSMQERNRNYVIEYSKLCKRLKMGLSIIFENVSKI